MNKRSWEEKLWIIVDKGEKILLRVIIVGFVALVVVQSMLTSDSMRFYLSWAERLEGQPLQEWSNPSARVMESESTVFAYLTVELADFSSLAKARILINGTEVADFRNKQVTIKVYPDDLIEIDGSFYDRRLKFEIIGVSDSIGEPTLHQVIQTYRSVTSLGKVKFK
ncbi:hypothetical protein [Candidatus Formimonas warabiya]|uniref:Uncharacterized protein n=1 Tax=Formimonas warabiya TaxID=1761012 RepID=A0A3G1KNR8_FORW1|nr:hypothetical protein [Candidatus Formimonas warabiya]ATW24097.1 hypothetical protein DCMF_04265 [Candidatus Formimonas warabiya]